MTLQIVSPVVGKPHREFAVHNLSRRNTIRSFAWLAAGSALASTTQFVAAEEVPLAIKGYDPVAYFTDGKPVRGLLEIEYDWDERRYRFSSAEHRELFKADPVHYAPQFGNYCAMALAKGEIVVANPENWLINDGKLYVFGKAAPFGPALFQQDLAANITKANENRSILPKN
jgi:YHS domain-containing protein